MGNSFAVFASVKLLWNFMAIYRQKPITVIPQNFYCNYLRTLCHGNSVCPYRIWLVMTASVYVKNCGNLDPRNKLHAIPRFTAGIICGPHRGSFAVQFEDHLRRCTRGFIVFFFFWKTVPVSYAKFVELLILKLKSLNKIAWCWWPKIKSRGFK